LYPEFHVKNLDLINKGLRELNCFGRRLKSIPLACVTNFNGLAVLLWRLFYGGNIMFNRMFNIGGEYPSSYPVFYGISLQGELVDITLGCTGI